MAESRETLLPFFMDLPKISILYHMKPTLSFVLQLPPSTAYAKLPPSTAYAKLESVVENLLKGVCMMLDSGKVKFSLFLDGPTIEVAAKSPRPLVFGKLRRAIEDGSLELLGGGYYDPMLPLFPTELQSMQLKKHSKLLWKHFGIEPSGYFNSSMVWEMEMTELLEKHRFEYALVQEASLQDALGRTTPVSGWYTVEDICAWFLSRKNFPKRFRTMTSSGNRSQNLTAVVERRPWLA